MAKQEAAKQEASKPVGVLGFEEIAAEGKIKSYTRSEGGGVKIAFKDLFYGDGHRPLLDRLMDTETKLRVTIGVIDPTFPES